MSYRSFIRQHGHPPFRPTLLQRLRLRRRARQQSKPRFPGRLASKWISFRFWLQYTCQDCGKTCRLFGRHVGNHDGHIPF